MAPAGTPEDIVQKLSAVYKKMAADPEVKKQMAVIGASTVFTTPDGFQTQINQEVEQWKALLKEISGK
jgi:tripartite-type tricarboxylate transporter receptor subunit TctC